MLRVPLREAQSSQRIVHNQLDVKGWIAAPPSCDEARPARCVACHAASRLSGRPLGIVGHGHRERQQWGPPAVDEPAAIVEVLARRYRCRACGAILIVVPRGVVRRRWYSGPAIALAFALWALARRSAAAVRRAVSPLRVTGYATAERWRSLGRWAGAVVEGRLFRCVRTCPDSFSAREVAERAATTLATFAPAAGAGSPPTPIVTRAFAGAAHAR